MVISDPAIVELDRVWRRMMRWATWPWRRGAPTPRLVEAWIEPDADPIVAAPPSPAVPTVSLAAPRSDDLTEAERRARVVALRGLMLARACRYEQARDAFAQAATFDPALDLAATPTFWTLHRAGQEAAVAGYERAGELRQATRLAALLRQRLRPRLLSRPSDAPAD